MKKLFMFFVFMIFASNVFAAGSIIVSWNASPASDKVAKYSVYIRANNSDGSGFVKGQNIAGTTASTVTTFTISNLADSSNYCVRVTASDAAGNESPFSDPAYSGVFDFTPPVKVGSSTNPVVVSIARATNSLSVTWPFSGAADGVVKYNIYARAENSDGLGFVKGQDLVGTVTSTVQTYTWAVTDSSNYCVRVTAVDTYGNESDFSDPVYSGLVDFTPPAKPSAITLTITRP